MRCCSICTSADRADWLWVLPGCLGPVNDEIGDILGVMEDELESPVGAQDRRVDGTPVAHLEPATAVRHIVLLHPHDVGLTLTRRAFQRNPQVADAGGRRIVWIIRKDAEQVSAKYLAPLHAGRRQIEIVGGENLEVRPRAHNKVWMRRSIEHPLVETSHRSWPRR